MPCCAVLGCSSRGSTKRRPTDFRDVHFHRFPKEIERLKEWVLFCGREEAFSVGDARVCSLHFKIDDYTTVYQWRLQQGQGAPKKVRLLNKWAVPSLHHPQSSRTMETVDIKPLLDVKIEPEVDIDDESMDYDWDKPGRPILEIKMEQGIIDSTDGGDMQAMTDPLSVEDNTHTSCDMEPETNSKKCPQRQKKLLPMKGQRRRKGEENGIAQKKPSGRGSNGQNGKTPGKVPGKQKGGKEMNKAFPKTGALRKKKGVEVCGISSKRKSRQSIPEGIEELLKTGTKKQKKNTSHNKKGSQKQEKNAEESPPEKTESKEDKKDSQEDKPKEDDPLPQNKKKYHRKVLRTDDEPYPFFHGILLAPAAKDIYDEFGTYVARTLREMNNPNVFRRARIEINEILLNCLSDCCPTYK